MGRFFEFLLKNPILLFVIGAWLIGMIGNVAKSRQKARARQRAQPMPQQTGRPMPQQQQSGPTGPTRARTPSAQQQRPIDQQQQAPVRQAGVPQLPGQSAAPQQAGPQPVPPQQAAEDVAREMRRILGLDPDAGRAGGMPTAARPTPPPIAAPQLPPQRTHGASAKDRRLDLHEQSHVGEGMRDRQMSKSKVGQPRAGKSAIGSLGGRTKQRVRQVAVGSRYSLRDLKRAIVLSEILAPPLSLRPYDERRPK